MHHTSKDPQKKHEVSRFFEELVSHLKEATEILVLGPGIAKQQFVHHLGSHHHAKVLASIVGTETCDHPTDNQLVAMARKFFTKQHATA